MRYRIKGNRSSERRCRGTIATAEAVQRLICIRQFFPSPALGDIFRNLPAPCRARQLGGFGETEKWWVGSHGEQALASPIFCS